MAQTTCLVEMLFTPPFFKAPDRNHSVTTSLCLGMFITARTPEAVCSFGAPIMIAANNGDQLRLQSSVQSLFPY